MEFKGIISTGEITAEFLADFSNDDPDLLIVGFSTLGGGRTDHGRDQAAPGGKASVTLNVTDNGSLEVILASGPATDSGRLRVSSNGQVKNDEPVVGPKHWVYSVEA